MRFKKKFKPISQENCFIKTSFMIVDIGLIMMQPTIPLLMKRHTNSK